MHVAKYWKAIVGGVAAGTAAAVTAIQDDTITTSEAITIALAVLASFGVTWAVPNKQEKETEA